jgi:glucose/arabinose dehydrogenase
MKRWRAPPACARSSQRRPRRTRPARAEIWAYGLRNPWRYAFDPAARLLYIADVGQNRLEEVDIAPLGQGGNNYGWDVMEGTQCFDAGAGCARAGLTLPPYEYDHDLGCSITGGYVYRGSAIAELAGRYLFSDYCGGWLKSFVYRDGAVAEVVDWPVADIGNVVSFGQDGQNELYVLSAAGTVYRVVRAP